MTGNNSENSEQDDNTNLCENKEENGSTTSNEVPKVEDGKPINYYEFIQNDSFYTNAKRYWSRIPPTIDGMLGGLSFINPSDIQGSQQFLKELFRTKPMPGNKRALDCGAGIGRVTKHLLMPLFETVDLVEQDENFSKKSKIYLDANGACSSKLGTIYNVGLQDFVPLSNTYDVIWSQWVLGHLTDDDLVTFFQRCIRGLAANGFIIIKENFTTTDDVYVDSKDSSVTRSLKLMKSLLENAGLRIVRMIRQDFIQGLFPVYMIACKPIRVESCRT